MDVIDTALELVLRAEVVDADQEGLVLAGTLAELEGVALWGAVAKALHPRGHEAAASSVSAIVGLLLVAVLLLLLGRRIVAVIRRRRLVVLLLLRRGIVSLGRALVVAAVLGLLRRSPLTWRSIVMVAGAVSLSWKHVGGCCRRR